MESIRVLVADDHTLFRKGLQSLLEHLGGIEVVGEAATGHEAVALAEELLPDVVLLDINMPGLSGIEATKLIQRDTPHVGIILVTMYDDAESIYSGMRAGARGYVLKGADPEELKHAIEAASRGEVLMSQPVAAKLLQRFERIGDTDHPDVPYDQLNSRELEVLRLAAEGLRNKEIADRLFLSEKTVKNRISNIFVKLRVNDRTQAILHGLRSGLIKLPDDQA